VTRLVLAEANLEPGPPQGSNARFSSAIAAQTEEEFVGGGYAQLLDWARQGAPSWAGELQVADPSALHRSAISLVAAARPTLRERLASLPMPRIYVFGAQSLANADMVHRARDLPRDGVRVLLVPDVGHGMGIKEDPVGFAEVLRAPQRRWVDPPFRRM